MRSSYKKLGPYIQQVDIRNMGDKKDNLLGVSTQKVFIESIANTVGTDFKKYKIVKRGQFTYVPDTSRRGDKIGLAMLDHLDEAIVSSAYTVFEVIDKEKLLPEYLMMWFRRPEFDRYARYMSHGSVREIFGWEEMCNVELPLQSIEKQREIVKEYKTITDRIKLNEQLNQKLEETAQAIYKQWFVDFEFPISREYALEIGKPELEGKPYKSSRREMIYNDELDQEIPKGWRVETVKDFCIDMKSGGTPDRSNYEYWNSNDVPWLKTGEIKNNIIIETSEFISNNGLKNSSAKLLPKDSVLMSMYGVNAGDIGILKIDTSTNQACCGMICVDQNHSAFLYYQLLYNQDFHRSQSIGGAQENLNKDYIEKIPFLIPTESLIEECKLSKIVDNRELITKEICLLNNTLNVFLSKMTKLEDSV